MTNLSSLLTYWWRVDEVDNTNGVTKGDLWKFRARHLAFPGAEGYGRFARGGRGGVVVEVTNLNDSGPGSFRDAIEGNYGPRTVVFTVSGLITLESDLIISGNRPYMTVAGQTAPGKGICTRKHQFGMSGPRDVICRYIRSRVGDISGETQNGSGMAGADHTIMDHCSISWGIDEEMSTRGAKNLTLQKVLISEALNIAGHDKYPPGTKHGYAASIGGDVATFHHNLLAHCEGATGAWRVVWMRTAILRAGSISLTTWFTTGAAAPPTAARTRSTSSTTTTSQVRPLTNSRSSPPNTRTSLARSSITLSGM